MNELTMKAIQRNKVSTANGHPDLANSSARRGSKRPPVAEAAKRLEEENARLTQGNSQLVGDEDPHRTLNGIPGRDGAESRNGGTEEEMTDPQRLLQAILDNIPDRIYFKDTQSRFIKLSQSLANRFGIDDPSLAIGKTDFELNSKIAGEYYQDEQRVMQTGQPLINKTEKQILPNGEIDWTSTTKMPLRNRKGEIIGLVGISRDITDLKRAEQALRESYKDLEQRVVERAPEISRERLLLRTLIDNLPEYVYVRNAEGRFVLANMAVARQMGFSSPDEIVGKSDFDLFPRELAERYRAEEDEMIQSGKDLYNHEGPTVDESKDPKNRWISTTKVILRDAKGKVTGFIGLGRDVTGRRQMEELLARERSLLRTLIDNLPDCIYAKDAAGRKILANPADLENYHCKTEAEAIGKTDFDLFPKDIAEKFWADDQRVLQGQPVINREEYFLSDTGGKQWLMTSKLPLRDQNGKIIGLVGIGRDITERKQAEANLAHERTRLRTLVDHLPVAIYLKDLDGRKTLVNPMELSYAGATSEAEVLGKTDFDLFPPHVAKAYRADDQKVLDTGEPVINRVGSFTRPDGSIIRFLTSKVALRDATGRVTGLAGINLDITERVQAEEALRESEGKLRQFATQLERSNRELQDFAYVASHDLQEPLRKIVVFGERLKEKSSAQLDTESRDYLERMQKAASRMQTLINDLLTFSRVTTKARPFSQVDLAEVAREVITDLEGRIELVKGRVEVGTLPLIDAEPLQMRQLLQNLIGNALKFRRPDTPPVVKIAAEIVTGPMPGDSTTVARKLCRLTVSDNGIGFNEKYIDRIFNVFQRLHSRNEYEGTGMGLAIVRKITLFHRGDITAKSKPGEGTTFIVTLPVTHPREPQTTGEKP